MYARESTPLALGGHTGMAAPSPVQSSPVQSSPVQLLWPCCESSLDAAVSRPRRDNTVSETNSADTIRRDIISRQPQLAPYHCNISYDMWSMDVPAKKSQLPFSFLLQLFMQSDWVDCTNKGRRTWTGWNCQGEALLAETEPKSSRIIHEFQIISAF